MPLTSIGGNRVCATNKAEIARSSIELSCVARRHMRVELIGTGTRRVMLMLIAIADDLTAQGIVIALNP